MKWQLPDYPTSELQHRFGDSVLLEFVRGHSYSAVLRELAQNEYDAGGRTLQVSFGDTGLEVIGNGKPIDRKGWRRLSVTLGTGSVTHLQGDLEQKANGIGSKNFGLRSLFLFGDKIYVRSNGRQTMLDLQRGTPRQTCADPSTTGTQGVWIYVPYRRAENGYLNPFTADTEVQVLDEFSEKLSLSIIKLANHGAKKSLDSVIVCSASTNRQITWKQHIQKLNFRKSGVNLLKRRITIVDSTTSRNQSINEFEWLKAIKLPKKFRNNHIPDYYRSRAPYIRLGLSLPMKKGKLDITFPRGRAYYPIGVEYAYTGNSVSINAPFEMDADRSELVDPSNSDFNAWLLDVAVDLTLELLTSDWFYRFGSDAYRAVGDISHSTLPHYSESLKENLEKNSCWPSRKTSNGRKSFKDFSPAQNLVIVTDPCLDNFLDDNNYLHPTINSSKSLRQLAKDYGAKEFTINSLIRLRCAGESSSNLQSTCKKNEACYYYNNFPDDWENLSKQKLCADALDKYRKHITQEHRNDLSICPTTLTASTKLDAAKDLWLVPTDILDVCRVPADERVHPELSKTQVIGRLSRPFRVADWIKDVLSKIENGTVQEQERESLYRYILSVHGRVPQRLVGAVRRSPVLRDHNDNWVPPRLITLKNTTGVRLFRPALYLPHRDYAKNSLLAKTLRFKNRITGDDVVRFAQHVSKQPKFSHKFEQILGRRHELLKSGTVNRLNSIAFLRTQDGNLASPSSLYLDTKRNRACMGLSVLYPLGKQHKLYERLRCLSRPSVEHIIEYLTTLRTNGQHPLRTEVIYPELVAALKRESIPDNFEDKEILWTSHGYSAPNETLFGQRWKKIFLETVPTVTTNRKALRQAYYELGVHDRPDQHHWKKFFLSLGEMYSQNSLVLTNSQRSAMRTAYPNCREVPKLPHDLPWLMDERGHLFTTSDADAGRFVIEDDVSLGTLLRKSSTSVVFADSSMPEVVSFFRNQGVKNLTTIRTKIRDHVGESRSAPQWFNEQKYIQRLACFDFGSALQAIAARDFSSDVLDRVKEIVSRLESLESIDFVQDMYTEYNIISEVVSVSTMYAWESNTIHLTWVRSRSGLESTLATLIAHKCLPNSHRDYSRFSDTVFRLLACQSGRELKEYLEHRGIRWRPESQDDGFDSENHQGDIEEALRAAFWPADRLPQSAGVMISPQPHKIVQPEPIDQQNVKEPALPPIENVTVQIVQPSGDWSYSPSVSGVRRGGAGGWSPRSRNEKWDSIVGHRGEEIVYRHEREKVNEAGHNQNLVVWVSKSNPVSNFDIESVDDDGEKLYIEVKATTGDDGRFFWSKPEFHLALQVQDRYILYRVYYVNDESPIVCAFRNPVALISSGGLHLDIESFRAEVQPSTSRHGA